MSEKPTEEMEVDSHVDGKEEVDEDEKVTEKEEDEGEEEEEKEKQGKTKRRSSMTLAEKRLNRLSSGMEMRGMMTESYECKDCKASFSRKSKLDYHIANTHPKAVPIPDEEPVSKRGRKTKTPKKAEKQVRTSQDKRELKAQIPNKIVVVSKRESVKLIEKRRQASAFLSQQQQSAFLKQQKSPKVTTISNEKVKYNWGYYCTACDMYFANMFAQQFHCLHGQAKFRCEACCICFKLRKNFMSHVQMIHGVDIPEEVLARMRPRSEIRAKQEADAEKSTQKSPQKQEHEMIGGACDYPQHSAASVEDISVQPDKVAEDEQAAQSRTNIDEKSSNASSMAETSVSNLTSNALIGDKSTFNGEPEIVNYSTGKTYNDSEKYSMAQKGDTLNEEEIQDVKSLPESQMDEPDVIFVSDYPVKEKLNSELQNLLDIKQGESGGNSSADEGEKKEEGRVYLTTVRMGNTYVTLPSGEKWMIECLRCHQAFFKMEDASGHMKQRPGSQFSCPHCNYSSTLFSQCDYEIHRLRTHSFPCAQCRQSFILECQRDMHEQKIHNYFRQLMRKKPQMSNQSRPTTGLNTDARVMASRSVVASSSVTSNSVTSNSTRHVVVRDTYPLVRTQRTPYVCLMCDRDCYTRDALEHHKKTFHSAAYRPGGKTHPVSKNPSFSKQSQRTVTGSVKASNAPVSKILEEIRQGPRTTSHMLQPALIAMQNPYLEPNKVPQAYITRIKVNLPEANKLVDDIRKELLKGPSNFAMPSYARPSKFNKDMLSNPAVVKLSREVAYKLYFDLQGPCNDSDKLNYKNAEHILYKIPMGCHSQKLRDMPLFPTLKDIEFRTQNYNVPPLNTVSPVEMFANFKGDLSMKDSINFSNELDNVMFGAVTKTLRALSMIYSSRRVAVSEGFWRLQTKALIAILKDVEDQRKAQIAERAKAASEAASAAAAAAASARPISFKLHHHQLFDGPVPVVDLLQQSGSVPSVRNGNISDSGDQQSNAAGTPMIHLVPNRTENMDVVSKSPHVTSASTAALSQTDHLNGQSASKNSSTSVGRVPSLKALAKKAAGQKDEEEKGLGEDKEKGDADEDKENKNETLLNGSASPTHGDSGITAVNGTYNGSTGEGSPPPVAAASDAKGAQQANSEITAKGHKPASIGVGSAAPTDPVSSLPNGTVHAMISHGVPTTVGSGGVINLNVQNGSVGFVNGIPIQLGNLGLGRGVSIGGGHGNGVISSGNGLQSYRGGGGLPGGAVLSAGVGGSVVLSFSPNPVQLVSVPQLANSVGALSAVASAPAAKQVLVLNRPLATSSAAPLTQPVSKMATPKSTVIPDSIAQFIQRNFVNIKPKNKESSFIPIKVEALPPDIAKNPSNGISLGSHPKVPTFLKLNKPAKEERQAGTVPNDVTGEDSFFKKVIQSVATLKQLQSSKFLPEDLCNKLIPLCDKITLPSTPAKDREALLKEVDAILKAESREVLRMVLDNGDIDNGNNNEGERTCDSGREQSTAAIGQFLNSLTQRIKYIQTRLTTRSIDPITLMEIVPLCQDVCDPKLPLKRKVECIAEIERKMREYEEGVVSHNEAATPVDIAAVPKEIHAKKDPDVYFKLQTHGSNVMVNVDDMELALEAIGAVGKLKIRLKRTRESDLDDSGRMAKRKREHNATPTDRRLRQRETSVQQRKLKGEKGKESKQQQPKQNERRASIAADSNLKKKTPGKQPVPSKRKSQRIDTETQNKQRK